MDLLLRGRGAEIGVRAPLWLVRATGAGLAFATVTMADDLGLSKVIGGHMLAVRTIALLGGALIAPTAAGAVLWMLCGSLVVVFLLVAYTPIVRTPALAFVRHDSTSSTPVDAVIIFSGGINEEGRLNGQVLDRLLSGLAQTKQRGVVNLALSVVHRGSGAGVVTSEADQVHLISTFAPELNVRYVKDVWSTHDEALMFAALARTHGWKRVLLVTSPLHTRRACRALEKAGLAVECFPAVPREYALTRLKASASRVEAFGDTVYEVMATVLYGIRGWI